MMGNRRVLLGSGQLGPSLDLNFMTGAMPSGITFTRASTAWGFNSSGVLTSATTNTPRFDYDPTTLTARGLLIEEARTNLVPGSMSNATYWSVLNTAAVAAATAPDGTASAVTLTGSAGGVTNYGASLAGGSLATITGSVATTASIFVKAGTAPWFRLILCDNSTPTIGAQVYLNMATGALGTVGTQSGSPTSVSATVQTVANGWYRLTLTATLGAATTASLLLRMTSANGTTTDTGSNTVVVFNPQLESNAAAASSPILTTTAAVTRAADSAVIQPLGSWFNETEGSGFAEFMIPAVSASLAHMLFSLDDATSNERLSFRPNAATLGLFVFDGAVAQTAPLTTTNVTSGVVTKAAFRYALNDFAICKDGGAVSTDTSGTLPTVTRMTLGYRLVSNDMLNGYLRRVRIYNRRLPDATLQVLTS